MTENNVLELAQNSAAVMLAYWRNPNLFKPCADKLFMLICERTYGQNKDEAALRVQDLIAATGRQRTMVSASIGELLKAGVISRRRLAHNRGHAYRINAEQVLELSAAA